jgi:hypothetical protein
VRRRSEAEDASATLLDYRPADWPSAAAWRAARRAWIHDHPPATLDGLNRFYAADVTFPLRADPRLGDLDAAA